MLGTGLLLFLFHFLPTRSEALLDTCTALGLKPFAASIETKGKKRQFVTFRNRLQIKAFGDYKKREDEPAYNSMTIDEALKGCFETTNRKICSRYEVFDEQDLNQDGLADYYVRGEPGAGEYGGDVGFIIFSSKKPGIYCKTSADHMSGPVKPKLKYKVFGFEWLVTTYWGRPDQMPSCLVEQFAFFTPKKKDGFKYGEDDIPILSKSKIDYRLETKDPNFVLADGSPRFNKMTACEVNRWLEIDRKNINSFCTVANLQKVIPMIIDDKTNSPLEIKDIGFELSQLLESDSCQKILTETPIFEGAITKDVLESHYSFDKIPKVEKTLGRYYFRSNFQKNVSVESFGRLSIEDQRDEVFIKDSVANIKKVSQRSTNRKKYYGFVLTLPETFFSDEKWARDLFSDTEINCSQPVTKENSEIIGPLEREVTTKIMQVRGENSSDKNILKFVNDWSLGVSERARCIFKKYPDPKDPNRQELFGLK